MSRTRPSIVPTRRNRWDAPSETRLSDFHLRHSLLSHCWNPRPARPPKPHLRASKVSFNAFAHARSTHELSGRFRSIHDVAKAWLSHFCAEPYVVERVPPRLQDRRKRASAAPSPSTRRASFSPPPYILHVSSATPQTSRRILMRALARADDAMDACLSLNSFT